MKAIVVIQARTNSSRLPAKVLLPIRGVPLVVLAAKRAANKGAEVIVVTSEEETDDELCRVLDEYGVSYFRGCLDNTLKRFVDALSKFDDDKIVVRLTADNVFPDGALLEKLERNFIENSLDYLACNGEQSGLPYGVSAELTKLGHLREALVYAQEPDEFEHVTPLIRKKFPETYYKEYLSLAMGQFRCTIDTLDDYLLIVNVFDKVLEPVFADLMELIHLLEESLSSKINKIEGVGKLIIGGAQLGIDYGINNVNGKPSMEHARRMLQNAYSCGVGVIDSARAYGESEKVIGQVLSPSGRQVLSSKLKIVTKLSPLSEFNFESNGLCKLDVERAVDNSVLNSLFYLKTECLDCLMLHRVEHLTVFSGVIWNHLKKIKSEGRIESLGASVQSPEELELALQYSDIEYIQLPYNVLDSRWEKSIENIKKIKTNRKLVIHVRSSLLQGLFVSKNKLLWSRAGVEEPQAIIDWLQQKVKDFDRETVADFCLAYVRSQDWIDGVVVGMETQEQLEQNIALFSKEILTQTELEKVKTSKPQVSEKTLNPALWSV